MAQDTLLEQLLTAEHAVWGALLRGDAAADAAVLDDGFLGVYPDGMFGKQAHVGQLAAGPTVATYRLSAARALSCGPEHGLLCYRADYVRKDGTREEAMYVSSLWRRQGTGWVNLFSQDTPATGQAVP